MWPSRYLIGVTSVLLPFWPPVPRYACLNKNPCPIIQVLYFVCPWRFLRVVRGVRAIRIHAYAVKDYEIKVTACCIMGRRSRWSARLCGESTRVGLQQLHSAGPVSGNVAGGGLFCVHLQPQTAGISAAVDSWVDAFRVALPGRGAGAVGARYAAADGAGSLAVRGGSAVFFPGRATLRAAQAVEVCGGRRPGGDGRGGRGGHGAPGVPRGRDCRGAPVFAGC